MKLDPELLEQAARITRRPQKRYDDAPSKQKIAAKIRAAEICSAVMREGDVILDVGHEMFAAAPFLVRGASRIEAVNLPQDMHELSAVDEFDGALAMHVLEHSPFPLYVLLAIRRALKEGGWLYVAVPEPTKKWITHKAHFTVLSLRGWKKLLKDAGFTILSFEKGKFGPKSIEGRFLCRRR